MISLCLALSCGTILPSIPSRSVVQQQKKRLDNEPRAVDRKYYEPVLVISLFILKGGDEDEAEGVGARLSEGAIANKKFSSWMNKRLNFGKHALYISSTAFSGRVNPIVLFIEMAGH